MSKKPFKGNYLTLENVRVYYDEENDSFHLTSKDKDIPKGASFNITLNQGKEPEMILAKILQDKNMMPKGYIPRVPPVPTIAHYDNTQRYMPWNEIPLGLGRGNKEFIWNVKRTSNLLMVGNNGSGKSVLQSTIIEHCLEHPDTWKLMLANPMKHEFLNYHNNPNVMSHAGTQEEAVASLQALHDIMMDRYAFMEKNDIINFRDLKNQKESPFAIMMIIDEADYFFGMSGNKTVNGKREDALSEKSMRLAESIVRLGRSAGIYLVVSSAHFSPIIFSGEFKMNFNLQVAVGRMSKDESYKFLLNDKATKIRPVPGRGYVTPNIPEEIEGECQFYRRTLNAPTIERRPDSHGEQAIYETLVKLIEAQQELDYRKQVMKMESVVNYADMSSPFKSMDIRINDFSDIMGTTEVSQQGDQYASIRKKMIEIVGNIARQGKAVGISLLVS